MKRCFLIFCLFTCFSCQDDENYPTEPVIKLVNVEFNGTPMYDLDTLKVTLSFTDGDGDLGFDRKNPSDTLLPYQPYLFFLKKDGARIPSDDLFTGKVSLDDLIRLSDRQMPPFDTLPDLNTGCYDVFIRYYGYSDPPYHIPNENHYNIFVDFLYEDEPGVYVEFDFYKEFCTTFDGRFAGNPGNSGPFTLKMHNEQRGELTYLLASVGFIPLFGDKKMKLRIYIKDRSLHNSNIIETAPFFLNEI